MANYVSNVTIPTDGGSTASYDIRELFPHIGNCTVAASAAAKTVTIGNFKLYTGAWVVVKFSNTNSADVASLTLNVDGTGAKPIKYRNANLSSAGLLIANRYTYFVYDGTNYQIVGDFDTNSDTYDRNRYRANIKAGTSALVAANIIVGKDGVFSHLKSGGSFDISYPILYLNAAVAAGETTNNSYDIINFTITTTQSISLTSYLPVFIKGTLSGKIFTPVSTAPLTQTVPTTDDGYQYMYLGNATSTSAVYLTERHPIYVFKNNAFGEIVHTASNVNGYTVGKSVPSDAVFTDTKVTQSSSTTSDFRPLLLGKNNQTNPENLETTVTDQTYVTKHVFVQPSTGNLTLYNASGDSPSLIFRRGTMIDNTLEWRIQNVGGKLNFDRDKNESTETWENIFQLDPSNNKMYFKNTEVSLSGHTHSQYLPKTTYEWNKEISFGNSGYLKIGSFPMYDTNITIDINATTSKTYHGTVVIATQNVSTTSMGSQHIIHVYDDPTGNIAASLRIVWTSGSRNYDIYFVPQSWSKNFIHIRALGNYMDGATDICVSQTGTAPATTSGLEPVNILSVTSTGNGNAVTKVEIDSVGNLAVTKGSTFLTSHQTVTDKNVTLAWETQKTVATIGSTDIHVTLPTNPVPSNNVTGSGTSGYLTKWNGTNTITNGPLLGSSTTTFLRNDGSWATPINTDEKVKATKLAQSTAETSYYPTLVTGAGTAGVSIFDSAKINHTPGTTSVVGNTRLILGNATASGTANNEEGLLKLYSPGTSYHTLKGASTSSVVEHTLPTTGGTILNSGTTSFTQSLTSGTKIGTIKINGTSTDLYCQTNTNTDTKVTQSETTTANYRPIVFGATNSTDTSTLAATITDQAYVSTLLYAQPQNGILYANRMYLKAPGSKGQLNLLTSKYNVMLRNDDSNTYFLVTAQNDPTGTWTSARPLTINNSTGVCDINGNAATATNANNVNTTVTNGSTSNVSYGVTYVADPNTSESNAVRKTNDFRISLKNGTAGTGGSAELVLGNNKNTSTADNKEGCISLYSSNTSYHTLKVESTTSPVIHTFPATAGTVLNDGTTSFTQSLTSGTKIGTIKINGTSTDLYCETNTNTDTKVTQTNTTSSADYRVLLSGNANDTTETTTVRKSTNLKFNPSSGGLYSFGFLWTDITGLTLDINTLTLSNGTLHSRRFIEKTDGGAANITNIPVTGKPFLLEVDLIRWASTTDYITRQRFTNAANGTYSYVRYCTSGTWGSWTTRKYTDTVTTVTTSGSGNAVTSITASNGALTVTKGSTFSLSNHTHTTTIAADSGTNQLTLAASTKYKLTAGETNFIFTTPPDTKNTAGSTDTSSKIYLVGATSQAANPQTYSDNEVYTTSGVLTTKKVQVGGGSCTMEYNSTTQTLDFVFA